MKKKLLVIGLDGGTFQIINQLVNEGMMPTFNRLLKQGVHGVLESTLDTNSPCAWSTFITGKNPGKHGIFGFFENNPGSYGVRFINGSFRSGKSLWKILSEHDKKVGIINVPTSYPAEEVNGFFISGPDAPSKNHHGFAYPDGIVGEIEEKVGEYIIEAGASALVRQGRFKQAIEKLHECINAKISIAKYLLKRDEYDFFMVVFTESDRVQHHFWKYINELHPAYSSPERERFGSAIYDVYKRLDGAIRDIIDTAGNNYSVIIMSDHGAGPSSNKTFFINNWLRDKGYLRFKSNTSIQSLTENYFKRLLGRSYIFAKSSLSRKWKRRLRNFSPGLKNRANSVLRNLQIDWENTKAFSWENAPAVYINAKDKFPSGTVEAGKEYESLIEAIKHDLLNLTFPENGEHIVKRVIRKEEVYWGPHINKAPDLFIEWKDNQFTVRPGYTSKNGLPIEVISGKELSRAETISRPSGIHRREGIFLIYGNEINRGDEIQNIHLYDVTATILYYLGIPIPGDFDGKVITEVFSERFIKENPVRKSEYATENGACDLNYSENESEIIAERLKGLGYID